MILSDTLPLKSSLTHFFATSEQQCPSRLDLVSVTRTHVSSALSELSLVSSTVTATIARESTAGGWSSELEADGSVRVREAHPRLSRADIRVAQRLVRDHFEALVALWEAFHV